MKIFPDTEAYTVSYLPGTSGSFICMLIAEFTNTLNQVEFSKNGNAHVTRNGTNQVLDLNFDKTTLKDGQLFSRFLETNPENPELPIILTEHYVIDHDLFFEKYPKGKVLYIQIDPMKDRLLIEANFYFKVQVDSYHEIPYWHQLWQQESPTYFNGAKDPFDPSITSDMIQKLIMDRANKHQQVTDYPFKIGDMVDITNVTLIQFSDILSSKQTTLETISNLTNRPIPISAYAIYDQYIEAQKSIWDFVKHK
jgi:hypothetical protein